MQIANGIEKIGRLLIGLAVLLLIFYLWCLWRLTDPEWIASLSPAEYEGVMELPRTIWKYLTIIGITGLVFFAIGKMTEEAMKEEL
ncbi:MAG: hypothetical protein ACO3MV_02075 [Flavobacteriales bacterium]